MTLTHTQICNFHPSPECLAGKTILVTGAGDGIGRVIALTYARHGAVVVLLGRTKQKLDAVADEIKQTQGPQPLIVHMDLEFASHTDMQNMAADLQAKFGHLDGVLHNAAILGARVALADYDASVFKRVMHINSTATFMLTQALLPLLTLSDDASVIFTTSSVGSKPRALWGAYALSKQAVEGMCDILTQEAALPHSPYGTLRFNCVNPGATRTDMRADAYPNEDPSTVTTADDITPGYVCLMSDASIGVQGQVIDLQPK